MKKKMVVWFIVLLILIILGLAANSCLKREEGGNYFFKSQTSDDSSHSFLEERINIPDQDGQSESLTIEEKTLVRNYLESNLTELSPESAVLGGTWYITDLRFIDNNLVVVDYEDGHIAAQALVGFRLAENKIEVLSFSLIPLEGEL